MTTHTCLDPRVGSQITRYELDGLSDQEQESFEQHLLDCSFCRNELELMLPVAGVLRANKHRLVTALTDQDLSFDEQRERLLEEVRSRRRAADAPSRLGQWIAALIELWRKPYVMAPALVALAACVLLIVRLNKQPESPFSPLLDYAPLASADTQVRGTESTTAGRLFTEGMSAYGAGDYGTAVSKLRKATQSNPSLGTGWLYLGVAFYVTKEPKSAIQALLQAVAHTDHAAQDYARFYLAQAYLLDNQPGPAQRLLSELDRQGGPLAARADSLSARVRRMETP